MRRQIKRLKSASLKAKGNELNKYIFPFEKLDVYRMALDLAERILLLLEQFPEKRHFRLISQMESAAVSIAQNIAEGKGRQYKKEFIQFLYIAQGSIFEVVTLTEIFRRKKLFKEEDAFQIRDMCEQIDRKLNGLINALKGNKKLQRLKKRYA